MIGPPVFASPQLRRAHLEAVRDAMAEHQLRLAWSRAEIEAEQTRALRALLRHALSRSTFYRDRLAGLDADSATPCTLASLPVTTKSDNSEPLLAETRALIERVWSVPVNSAWGSTEVGMHAADCDLGRVLHLHDDAVVLERVDDANRPVGDDEPAARVLLTTLANLTFPFIRYELDDVVTFADGPCSCGSAFRLIAGIEGRPLDAFSYRIVELRSLGLSLEEIAGALDNPGAASLQTMYREEGPERGVARDGRPRAVRLHGAGDRGARGN